MSEINEPVKEPLEQEDPPKKKRKKEKVKKSVGREIFEWIMTIVAALVITTVVKAFIFELVRVEGSSMKSTLADQEIMLVTKYEYSSTWLTMPFDLQNDNAEEMATRFAIGTPKRLDIVICRYPARGDTNFVKRIVGLPGDTVELKSGYLFVNGEQVMEEAEIEKCNRGKSSFGPYYVPKKGDSLSISAEDGALVFRVAADEPNELISYDRIIIDEELSSKDRIYFTADGACLQKYFSITAKDQDGKVLKMYYLKDDSAKGGALTYKDQDGNTRYYDIETVISYDGKLWRKDSWDELMPALAEKTLTVDEDCYFVMGDNRGNSFDSRGAGALERSAIIGHVRRVLYPFNAWRGVE